MKKQIQILFILLFCFFLQSNLYSQVDGEDLLSMLEEEETIDYVSAAFKTNRVINLHSIENTAKGVLDVKISHRFGFLSGGFDQLFGLDDATIRFGFDYGITENLMIGVGRSSYEKNYDGFAKYRFLRQSKGKLNMPLTAALFASAAIKSIPFQNPDRENYFSSRMNYTFQVILGRKFNKYFSLQLSPTVVHRNLVRTNLEKNDVYALGAAARMKLNNRLAINAEYIYVWPNQLAPGYRNSLSIGLDIETGGHVFQLHFTNSTSMIEKGFITETVGEWSDMGIHFGFNVSRVFTIVKPKKIQ